MGTSSRIICSFSLFFGNDARLMARLLVIGEEMAKK